MNIRILVATHKKASVPPEDIYQPIHVGKALTDADFGFEGDNVGDNISARNKSFCELTAVYWAWKNLSADYVGLVHYRRFFAKGVHLTTSGKFHAALLRGDFERLLGRADVVLPCRRHYWVETTRGQYEHAHNPYDMAVCEQVIAERHPECLDAFGRVMGRTSGHRFNMFVMKRALFDDYCAWLFDILFEMERRIDISGYNAYNKRVFGFIGERLLDVWIEARGVRYVEANVYFLGRMNWLGKIYQFLKRKTRGGADFEG